MVDVFNVRRINDKSKRSYVSFGDVFSEIGFTKSCSSKLIISLSIIFILRIEVEDMKKTCWG